MIFRRNAARDRQLNQREKLRRRNRLSRIMSRQSRLESLEDRNLLAAVDVTGNVLTFNDSGAENNDVSLSVSGGDLLIQDSNHGISAGSGTTAIDANTVSVPLGSFDSILINGADGDDHLTVDFTGGDPIPAGGLEFNGGTSGSATGDSLSVIGSFTDQILNYDDPGPDGNNGDIDLDGSVITYTGLEPINAGNSVNTILNLPVGLFNDATLQDSAASGEIEIIDNGATFEDTVIPNPTNSLTVNLGDQGDLLYVSTLDAGYAASLVVSGGSASSDQVTLDNVDLIDTPGRGLWVTETEFLYVDGGTIAGNTAPIGAGVLIDNATSGVSTTAVFEGAAITGNTATGAGGGGIYNRGGGVVVLGDFTGSRVSDNMATGPDGSGGGIYNDLGGTLAVDAGSVISGNSANRSGGGIEDASNGTAPGLGTTLFPGFSLSNNTATGGGNGPGNGGGLHVTGNGTIEIYSGTINGNTAAGEGGGLWNGSGLMIIDDVTIDGNTASGTGPEQSGGGVFNDGGSITITGGTISNNTALGDDAGEGGGGIFNDGFITLDNTSVIGNTATNGNGNGGGIFNSGGATLIVNGGSIENNQAARAGGGIENNAGTVTLDDVLLEGNTTGINGGGLHTSGIATTNIIGGLIGNNTAGQEGGGLWNAGVGTMTIDGTTISGNTASGDATDQGGGGIFQAAGATGLLDIDNATISGNTANGLSGSGGGIFNDTGGTVLIDNTLIENNQATRAGGGIEDNAGTSIDIFNSVVRFNDAGTTPGNGGGLHITGAGTVNIEGSTINGNTAAEGGGLWNSGVGTLSVSNSTISGNEATSSDGGGIFNTDGGTINLDSVTITLNEGTGTGDGIAGGTAGVTLQNTIVAQNPGGGAEENLSGTINSLDFNLIGDLDTGVLTGRTSNTIFEADALLLPLLDQGGPFVPPLGGATPTHLPAVGSPAIGFGSTGLLEDQRDVLRPQGSRDDIGAVEADLDGFVIDADDLATGTAGDGNPDEFRIVNDSDGLTGDLLVEINSRPVFAFSRATTGVIVIRGSADDDTLIIDTENGLIGTRIVFDGDGTGGPLGPPSFPSPGGFDSLVFNNINSPASLNDMTTTYNPGSTVDAGGVFQEANEVVQKVEFFGLEPIQVLAPVAGNNILNLASAPLGIGFPQALNGQNSINYVEGPNSNDPGDVVFAGALTGLLTVDGFESLEFANFEVLNIDAGAGSDEINLNNPVNPDELGAINVDGGDPTASDTVVVNGTVLANSITVDTLSNDGAVVSGAQGAPVAVSSTEHLIINGLGGADELTIETPSGQDQIQFTTGDHPDSGLVEIEDLGSQSLLSISFKNLGIGAQLLEFTDVDGAPADDLFVVGTDHDERFTVNSAGSIFLADSAGIPTTPVITTAGVLNAVLQGLSGSDEFFVAGDHPFDTVLAEGGNPGGGSDVLLFTGSGAAVTHSPDNAAILETGSGAVAYNGVERVIIDANSSLVVEGSTADDLVRVTPENTDNDGTYEHSAGAGIAFEYSDAGSVTFHGEGGIDEITVLGDTGGNTIVSLGVDISVDASDVTIGNDVESVVIDGLSGNDLVDLSLTTLPRTTVYGREGNDRIFGTIRNADFTIAQTTNTLLVLDGGVGDDELTGGSSSDRIIGGDGNDIIDGAPGRDVMLGGADSDEFRWTPGDSSDLVEGGTGANDELLVITSDNADLIQLYGGGLFDDSLFGLYPPQALLNGTRAIVDLDFGSNFINTGDVEAFEFNTRVGDDSIVINNQADFTSRGDSPVGGGVAVNRGTDLGATSTQSVKIDGGDNTDYVDIHGTYSDDNIDVDFVGGDVTVTGTGVEIHIANDLAGGDTLHIHGQSGDDNIKAAPSVEVVMSITLEGDGGNDVLDADAILIGGAGDDFLQGGVGDDLLLGGAGEDTMVGGSGNDSFDGGSGFDTILIAGTSADDVIDVVQTNPSTLTHTVNGDTQIDIIAPSTVERALVEAGDGADLIRVNWQDAIGINGADDSLRMTVNGGDDSTFDRLVVVDDDTDDLTLYRQGSTDDSGTVQIGPGNAEPLLTVFDEIERVQFVDENGLAIDNTAGPQLVVFKHDPFEYNDDRFTATYLGSGDTINVDPTIDPGALVNPFGDGQNIPGDNDYYRIVAEKTGTLDFQVYFRHVETLASGRPGLPNGGDLNIAVRDSAGNVIAGFGTNDGDDDERVRIPAVQGETYYLQVVGALAAVNVYNITVVNHEPPVPYALELLDNPADGTTNPPGGSTNSDTGRSQFDNVTYDDTPTLFFRLDDGIFLHDLPGNPADATPPDEVIPIPFQPGLAQPNVPGYAIAIFDEGNTPPQTGTAPQTPLGFATAVPGQEGIYTFTVPNALALSEGSHFLTARVQMIDPAVAQETGFGGRSLPLEIVVDTTPPPVFFGLQGNADDGLHPDSDSGDAALPITLDDRITNDETPTFFGRAEANSIVRAYLDLDDSSTLSAGDLLIGQTVATPLDGTNQLETPLEPNEPGGQWELTSTVSMNDPDVLAALGLPKDGLRRILISAEDLAGNITPPDANEILEVFIDSQGPQVTDVYITAFPAFDIFTLKPDTPQPTPRVDSLTIAVQDLPERIAPFFYNAVSNVPPLAPIVLVGDHSGVIPIANLAYISTNTGPGIATGEIVLDFDEPLPDDRFTLTLADNIIDPAGNQLDGENNAAEPIGSPFFPTGDEIPGGDFIARFTVDSRPEVATWSQGIVYADINGNFVWDPEGEDNDFTNRDFAYNFGEITDAYFAGNFSANATSSWFDKVGAYGAFNGTYEFFLDTDDDGIGDTIGAMAFQVNAIPVAGNFFNSAADDAAVLAGGRPRDEIGAFDGQNWYLDVNGNNNIDAGEQFATELRGIPVVGDFNGDGNDDLATFNNDTGVFQFDLDRDGDVDNEVTFGFSGFGEKPVAGDFNLDGIDDIGMWVPGREGQLPDQSGEFHFLISDTPANLPSNVFEPFSPAPLGNDIISQFGDEFALPLFGNFDPPIAKDGSGATFVGSLTNDSNPLDTNGDGSVTALDALVVINALGSLENTEVTRPTRTVNAFNGYRLDASADGQISALDALFVINELGRQANSGSGELVSASLANDDWVQSADSVIADLDDDEDLLGVLAADQELQRVKS